MKPAFLFISLLTALFLAGCASAPKTVFKNEQTGQIVICSDDGAVEHIVDYTTQKKVYLSCVEKCKQAGLKKVRQTERTYYLQ